MRKKWVIVTAICTGLIIAIAFLFLRQPNTSTSSQDIVLTAQYLVSSPMPVPSFIISLEPSPGIEIKTGGSVCVEFSIGYLLNPGEKLDDLPQFLAEHTQLLINGQKPSNKVTEFPPVFGGELPNGQQTGHMKFCARALNFAKGVNLAEVHTEDMLLMKYYYAWAFTVA